MMRTAIRFLRRLSMAGSALWFVVGVVALIQASLRGFAPMEDYLAIFGLFVAVPALLFGLACLLSRRLR